MKNLFTKDLEKIVGGVITSQGEFKCETACQVADDGSVTDVAGGKVWKKIN